MPEPTAYDQFLLELINKARANPTAEASRLGITLNQGLNSGQISTAPKQPLAFDGDLVDAAHKHSKWMLDTDTFSHTGAGGSSFTARMKAEGYVFSGSWTAGENISWGGTTGTVNQLTHTQARHDGLFKSPGHRVNILNDNFKEIGTGVEFGKYGAYNASMVTEDFAKSGTASFITGVAYDDRNDNNFYTPGEGRGGIKVSAVSTGTTTPVTVIDLTGTAGGYDIAVAPGTYKVTFSEGGLAAPITRTVTVGSKNVKIDLIDPPTAAAQVAGVSASASDSLDFKALAGSAGNQPAGHQFAGHQVETGRHGWDHGHDAAPVPADYGHAMMALIGVPDGHHQDAHLAA